MLSATLPLPNVTFAVPVNSFTGPLSTEYVPFTAFSNERVVTAVSVENELPLASEVFTTGSFDAFLLYTYVTVVVPAANLPVAFVGVELNVYPETDTAVVV